VSCFLFLFFLHLPFINQVCGEKERLATVRGCKWVDEVVENVPYVMSDEYLRWVIGTYKIIESIVVFSAYCVGCRVTDVVKSQLVQVCFLFALSVCQLMSNTCCAIHFVCY